MMTSSVYIHARARCLPIPNIALDAAVNHSVHKNSFFQRVSDGNHILAYVNVKRIFPYFGCFQLFPATGTYFRHSFSGQW